MTTDAQSLRREAERRLADREASGHGRRPEDIPALLHELGVHQIELELQNEELRRIQDELEAAREKYFALYDLAPVGYAVLNDMGLFVQTNLTLTSRLGVSRTALIGRPLNRFVNPTNADAVTLQLRRLFETGEPSSFEVGMVMEDGTPFQGRLDAVVHDDSSGSRCCRVTLTDVTERKRAEAVLKASEARFRTLFEKHAAVMLLVEPKSGQIVDANLAAERFYGYDRATLRTMRIDEINMLDPLQVASYRTKAAEEVLDHFVFPHRLATGDVRFVEVHSSPIEHEGTRILFSVIHDITERKRAEEDLRANRALLQEILDSVPQAVFWKNQDSVYLGCNRPFARWVGLADPEEVIGKSDFDLSRRREEADAYRAEDALVMGAGLPRRSIVEPNQASNGAERWVETTKVPMLDARGEAQGILGVFEDITERRHVERMKDAAYQVSEAANGTGNLDDFFGRIHAILGELIQARNFYIALLDPTTETLEFPYFVDEFDPAPAPKPAGRGLTEFVIRTGKPLLASREDLEDLVVRGEVEVHGTFPLSWLGSPLEVSGVTIGALVVQRYTSEGWFTRSDVDFLAFLSGQVATAMGRKRAEQELRTLYAELEQRVEERTAELSEANRELEAFSYSISHELRTPLRAIDGFSARVSDAYAGLLGDEGRRLFGEVRWNAQRMGRLIDDLLEFSRAGDVELSLGSVNMTGAARAAFALAAPKAESRARISLSVDDLPDAHGEARLLGRVWDVLLSNAVKFSAGREKPEIRVEGSIQGEEAIYRVRDNGVGFDMKYVEKLFGVFHRLHGHREFEGTGVGLALVRRIVVRHGGKIWAEGELDRGATFSFALPVKPRSDRSTSGRKLVRPPGTTIIS